MPVRTFAARAATLDDWIYVLLTSGPGALYRYRHDTRTWEAIPSAPATLEAGIDLVGAGTDLHLLVDLPGGTTGLEIYDPLGDAWLTGPVTADRHHLAAEVAGDVFALGGVSPDMEWFDPVGMSWVPRSPMPLGFTPGAAETDGVRLYAFDLIAAAIAMYDPVADLWSDGPFMPQEYEFQDSAVIGNRIYLVKPRLAGSSTLAYNFVTDSWKKGKAVARRRDGAGAAAWDGRLFLFGGTTPNGCYR